MHTYTAREVREELGEYPAAPAPVCQAVRDVELSFADAEYGLATEDATGALVNNAPLDAILGYIRRHQ